MSFFFPPNDKYSVSCVGIEALGIASSNPQLWAWLIRARRQLWILINGTWKSHNSALKKGTCSYCYVYDLYSQHTFVIIPTLGLLNIGWNDPSDPQMPQWYSRDTTHRNISVLVENNLKKVGRQDRWRFESLLRSKHIHFLTIRSWRWAGKVWKIFIQI